MFLLYSVTTAGLRTVTRHLSFDDHLMQLSWCTTPWTLEATRSALLSCHFVPATSDGFLTIISDVSLPWCHPTPLTCTGALSLFPGDLLFQHIQYVDRDEVPVKVQVCSTWKRLCYLSDYIPSDSQLLVSERIPALVDFRIQHQTAGTDKKKCCSSVGFGFPDTNCLRRESSAHQHKPSLVSAD